MVQTTWGWLIVIYLFLGGLGAGAFLCSALAYKGFLGSLNERFYKFGFLLAPVAVIIGTALLLFDLAPSAAALAEVESRFNKSILFCVPIIVIHNYSPIFT